MVISKALRSFVEKTGHLNSSLTVGDDHKFVAEAVANALEDGTLTAEKFAELNNQKTPADVFGNVRLKKPSERYSTTKSVAKHAKTGMPVLNERAEEVQTVSTLETVKAGVLLKKIASRSGMPVSLNEHENELLEGMYAEDEWVGKIDGEYKTGIDGMRVKVLLNDSTSGGAEAVPAWFDDAVIQIPLLHSELLPRVDLREVPRGRNVEAVSVGNPSVIWGTAASDGTSLSPFDTTALVAAVDTTIQPVACAVEVGRDFLADSAADIGRVLLENIGQSMLQSLDYCIAVGNGTSQPQGVFNATGITDIGNPAGGAGAAPQVEDYETLLFGTQKQFRPPNQRNRQVFLANETTYKRARSLQVGASDERRVFGLTHEDYQLLGHPFCIQHSIGNAYAGFFNLAHYRLYRRQAQEVRFVDGGRELALKNQVLLVVRGRFGGKLVLGGAGAFTDNMQA